MFLKPKLHKESKNGSKTINCRPYPVLFFQKTFFGGKKNHHFKNAKGIHPNDNWQDNILLLFRPSVIRGP